MTNTDTPLRPDLAAVIQQGRLTQVDVTAPTQTDHNLDKRKRQRQSPRSEDERRRMDKRRIPFPEAHQEVIEP